MLLAAQDVVAVLLWLGKGHSRCKCLKMRPSSVQAPLRAVLPVQYTGEYAKEGRSGPQHQPLLTQL